MKKTLLIVGSLVLTSLLFSGCLPKHKLTNNPADTINVAREKVGDTTVVGKITKVGDKYFITVSGRQPQDLDSYSVKLDQYVGKKVKIVGQYSGDTLFVGKIEKF